jgi:hypothetical protein
MVRKLTPAQRRAYLKEAEEWDRLNDEDWARLFDEGTPVNIHLRRPQAKALTVALDAQKQKQPRRVASRRQIGKR